MLPSERREEIRKPDISKTTICWLKSQEVDWKLNFPLVKYFDFQLGKSQLIKNSKLAGAAPSVAEEFALSRNSKLCLFAKSRSRGKWTSGIRNFQIFCRKSWKITNDENRGEGKGACLKLCKVFDSHINEHALRSTQQTQSLKSGSLSGIWRVIPVFLSTSRHFAYQVCISRFLISSGNYRIKRYFWRERQLWNQEQGRGDNNR